MEIFLKIVGIILVLGIIGWIIEFISAWYNSVNWEKFFANLMATLILLWFVDSKYPEYTILVIILIVITIIVKIFQNGFSKFFFGYIKDPRYLSDNEIYHFTQYKNGQQYKVDISIKNFPIITALNLKGKKHEWFVIGFEKENKIKLVYSHKGFNNYEVHSISNLLLDSILEEMKPTALYVFHNHPNGVLEASKQDKKSAKFFSKELMSKNIKLYEFVCARGEFIQYY